MRLSNFLTTSQNVRKAADQANCDGKWHTASQKTLLYKNDLCGRNSSTESIININFSFWLHRNSKLSQCSWNSVKSYSKVNKKLHKALLRNKN